MLASARPKSNVLWRFFSVPCGEPRHLGLDRCIFHAPSDKKNEDTFQAALKERVDDGKHNFDGFVFVGRTSFDERVLRDTSFDGAEFLQDASFIRTRFDGNVGFSGTKFKGEVNFGHAEFNGEADFRQATFHQRATFRSTFRGLAWFSATFHEEAQFAYTMFYGKADFGYSKFLGPRVFSDLRVRARHLFHGSGIPRHRQFRENEAGDRYGLHR